MLNVGLTGNIAAGKSTVVQWFAEWGATVVDADQLVRDVQRPGSPVLAAIAARFGADVLTPDGSLDRPVLRQRVMGDDDALAVLNGIVHPAVRRERTKIADAALARGDCVLVNDIPLLFEVLDPKSFDLVVLVDASRETRRHRLTALRGLAPADADRLMASQLPSEHKRMRSDIVLDNDGSLEDLRSETWRAWETIRAQAARRALGAPGRLLAVVSTAGEEAWQMGGTLARYADAGVDVAMAYRAGALDAFQASAAALGVASLGSIGPEPMTALPGILQQFAPTVILTTPDLSTAASAAGQGKNLLRLCTVVTPAPPGAPPGAVIDVRPWQDRKRLAAKGYDMNGAAATATWLHVEREAYHADPPHGRRLTDLFQGLQPS